MINQLIGYLPGIGAAVVTALLTTVVVEYLAKPRLEARKARLIRDRQQIDEVIFAFQRVSMALGAVLSADSQPDGHVFREVHQRQVVELGPLIVHLQNSLARLPVSYVYKHGRHISMTAKFLGYAQSLPEVASRGVYVSDEEVRQIADDTPRFDTYFVANVDFHDSQEPLIKRWFWKRFTAKGYRADAVKVMDARYGGALGRRDN